MKIQFNVTIDSLDDTERQLSSFLHNMLTFFNLRAALNDDNTVDTTVIEDAKEHTIEYRVSTQIDINEDDLAELNLDKISDFIMQL